MLETHDGCALAQDNNNCEECAMVRLPLMEMTALHIKPEDNSLPGYRLSTGRR